MVDRPRAVCKVYLPSARYTCRLHDTPAACLLQDIPQQDMSHPTIPCATQSFSGAIRCRMRCGLWRQRLPSHDKSVISGCVCCKVPPGIRLHPVRPCVPSHSCWGTRPAHHSHPKGGITLTQQGASLSPARRYHSHPKGSITLTHKGAPLSLEREHHSHPKGGTTLAQKGVLHSPKGAP